MKKYSEKYNIRESLDDKYKDKVTGDYESLKIGILNLLDKSVENSDDLVNIQNFMNEYRDNPENATLVGLVDDAEIFDFYMKYQSNVDEMCESKNYFDKSPKENNVFSLYAFIINGTKFAVQETMKDLENDLFSEGEEKTQTQPQ